MRLHNRVNRKVWDRHADSDPSDGLAAVEMMESMSRMAHEQAQAWGAAMVPYHLMFAKLKTMRPSVQLLSDGTHATYPVGYGLATMSVVARTGLHPPTDDLDDDTRLAAQLRTPAEGTPSLWVPRRETLCDTHLG